MSDQELRTLERAAATDPGQTVAFARALARAGRADDGLLALCKAIDRPEVRAELAGRPPRRRELALDAPPVRREPRVRWRSHTSGLPGPLEVDPLSVVTTVGGAATQLRDPRTGAVRFLLAEHAHLWLDGGRLLGAARSRDLELLEWEPWSVARLGRGSTMGAHVRPIEVDQPCLMWLPGGRDDELAPRPLDRLPFELVVGALPDVTVSGGSGWVLAWPIGAELDLALEVSRLRSTLGTGGLGLWTETDDGPRAALLDPATGAVTWQRACRLLAADAAGALVHEQDALVALDPAGDERWRVAEEIPGLLGPEVCLGASGAALTLRDRATGHLRAKVEPPFPPLGGRGSLQVALVRDVLLVVGEGPEVAAWTLDGGRRWSLDLRDVDRDASAVVDLAALPGALVLAYTRQGGGGAWVCLEEAR